MFPAARASTTEEGVAVGKRVRPNLVDRRRARELNADRGAARLGVGPRMAGNLIGPTDAVQRQLLLKRAIENLRTRSTRGTRSSAWKLGDRVVFEAAYSVIQEMATLEEAASQFATPRLLKRHGVTVKVFVELLTRIRDSYRQAAFEKLDELGSRATLDTFNGDPGLASEHLFGTLLARWLTRLENKDVLAGMDPQEMHVPIRLARELAKLGGEKAMTRLREAQAEKVLAAMKAAEDAARGGATLSDEKRREIYEAFVGGSRKKAPGTGHQALVPSAQCPAPSTGRAAA